MRSGQRFEFLRAVSRFALVGAIGSLAGACSMDSKRLTETPFTNPFKTANAGIDETQTGSVDGPAPSAPAYRRSTIRSEPLPPVASSQPSSQPAQSPPTRTASAGAPGWSATGGTPVTVGSGDSLSAMSSRYGVPGEAILAANGLTASQVTAGRQLVIPVYSATGAPAPSRVAQAAPAEQGRVVSSSKLPASKRPVSVADASEAKPRSRPGQTKTAAKSSDTKSSETKPAPRVAQAPPAKSEPAKPAKVAAAKPVESQKTAAKVEPKTKAEPKMKAESKTTAESKTMASSKTAAAPVKTAKAEPAKPAPQQEAAKPAAKEPEATGTVQASGSDFRWPARGRVISGFGTGSNEGINIAVPDGTPVKAAGDGVVAYAGSEVKGYGNLVLIRHDNGYVSAYAHNGEIDVKRGQKVARGQTIAKSGQSGNVTSPQLHFEIRKGSTPVDPMRHLASAS